MTTAAHSLFLSIHSKNVASVTNFLREGVINLDERDKDGQTFLMVASQVGCSEIVQLFLEHPDMEAHMVNAVDNDNWSALLNAAKEGHVDVVTLLAEHNADLEHKDSGGWTALMWACYKGRTEVAERLLQHGANPNVRGEHNMSCLTWAAGRGFTEIVRLLLENEAKVNTSDKYGTTPLMWAARKGYTEIAEMLLEEGATIDNAGMNSWTALIVASKGGYTEVVKVLLQYSPNVNAVDKDSYTALTHAAKEGYVEIVQYLLEKGAYVNRPDRYGDTILIHATKGGHVEVARILLKKHVDLDVQGVDEKTALYWTVEKNHPAILKMLLDHNAGSEIPNKDGDTPLLKAVRCRNLEITKMLLDKGAKISATDKRGDTALHVSVRGRSKRVTELLLRNPKDGRLLYRPNKGGETPYQLDSEHEKRVLTQVFGARNLNADDNIEGYELYGSTIADVLSEPSLNTPITVGLYAKWGSGKSFLIKKLVKEMKNFTQHNADPLFEFSGLQFAVSFLFALLVGVVLALGVRWEVGLGVGLGVLALQYFFLAMMWVGSVKKDWGWAYYLSVKMQRRFRMLRLLLQVMFCNEPPISNRDTVAVKFLFTDNARLASVVGEKSIPAMISTLCDAMEQEYGTVVTRLYKVLKPGKASEHGRFKSLCCIPYFLIVVFILCCIITASSLIFAYGPKDVFDSEIETVDGIVIAFLVVIGIAFLGNIYTWSCMIMHLAVSPRKHIQKIMTSTNTEGRIQNLKKEVELIGQLCRCMDAFLKSHTRLVAVVDGLDSCEQEKLLQVLDTVHMLFSDDKSPFVTILAVDPHVIIKGIEHNLHGLFRDSSINGHDYLRNLVQLPFFLHSQAMPRSRASVSKTERTTNDTVHGSTALIHDDGDNTEVKGHAKVIINHLGSGSVSYSNIDSMSDIHRASTKKKRHLPDLGGNSYVGSSAMIKTTSHTDLSKSIGKSSYFSDINPRNMKRMMNIIAVTGRLLRACHVDFNWYKLSSWINISEQWPYRLSWIILEIENSEEFKDNTPLKAVFDIIAAKLPPSREADPYQEIDRNEHKLKVFLENDNPRICVGDLRRFMPCTINVDPYLRKLIKEQMQTIETMNEFNMNMYNPSVANFDNYGMNMLGSRRNTITNRMELSPRSTPRPPSAMRLAPGMYPNMGMFASPPPGPPFGMPQGQFYAQNASTASFSNLNTLPRPSSRVNIQGGMPVESLNQMTVEDVCGLLYRLEGLNKARLGGYIQCFQENNISGPVLMTCEMAELKPVVAMSFGDWELFRSMVQCLRDNDGRDSPLQSPKLNFTQDMPFSDNQQIQVPQASYPASSAYKGRKNLSEHYMKDPGTLSDFHRSRSSPAMKKINQNYGKSNLKDPQGFYQRHMEVPQEARMGRKDSYFGEVMMESAALRGVIEAVGVITDTGEDTDEEILQKMSPVVEEKSPPKRSKSIKDKEHRSSSSAKTKQQRKPEEDPRYKVHHSESGDSDSEEVVKLSRQVSTKSVKSRKSSVPKVRLSKASSRETSTDSLISKAPSRESLRYGGGGTKKKSDADQTKGTVPLLKDEQPIAEVSGNQSDLILFLGNESDHEVIDVKHQATTPESSKPTSSANMEVEYAFEDPSRSTEHLSLRKLCPTENVVGPSAFKSVTPTSSRASSRASSCRGMSITESLDGQRLSITDGAEMFAGITPGTFSRQSSRKMSPGSAIKPNDSVVVNLSDEVNLPLTEHSQVMDQVYVDAATGKINPMATEDDVEL